ncbi:MAG: hypothetical protein JXR10_09655 [Cyclobacteriaceae bacterium]
MRIFITLLFLILHYLSVGQHAVNGVILNDKNEKIPFCHVYNSTLDMGKVSDKHGKFSLIAERGDTVFISSVGYQSVALIIEPEHQLNFLKVVLPQDSILLPSITIYADPNYRVPLSTQGGPMQLFGMERRSTKSPIKAGDVGFGVTGVDGIPLPGVVMFGPLTYFSKDEVEKRKAAEAYEETRQTITYQRFIAQDSVRQKLQRLYEIDSAQYDIIIVRLNRQFPGIQKQYNPVEIWNWLLAHFDRTAPIVKGF